MIAFDDQLNGSPRPSAYDLDERPTFTPEQEQKIEDDLARWAKEEELLCDADKGAIRLLADYWRRVGAKNRPCQANASESLHQHALARLAAVKQFFDAPCMVALKKSERGAA